MMSGLWRRLLTLLSCACFVGAIPKDFNPHSPVQQTWEVLNEGGRAVWTIAEVHPLWTWWPDLFPDICKLAIGAPPGWDLEGYSDIQRAPLTPPPYVEKHSRDPWGGCSNQRNRSMLQTHPPGPTEVSPSIQRVEVRLTSFVRAGVARLQVQPAGSPPRAGTILE